MQASDMISRSTSARIRVWDLPLRLFHWALTICVIGSFVTANFGGLWMDYHFQFGYAILALLLFRLVWGFFGPRTARFASFLRGPSAILAYVRQRGVVVSAGHNPLGALSVILMLVLLLIQVATGLFATDGILSEGPLSRYVSHATADRLTGVHQINRILILIVIGLHLLAIAWYAIVRRQPLVRAMITGNKRPQFVPDGTLPTEDGPRIWLRALFIVIVAAAIAVWIARL